MKKILIITDMEQASPRIIGFITYLKYYGFKPIILCPEIKKDFWIKYGELKDIIFYEVKYKTTILERITKRKKKNSITTNTNNNIIINLKKKYVYFILRFGFLLLANFINYPDSFKYWQKEGEKKGKLILKKYNIKIIFSSSSPVSAHIIASKLTENSKINWIADFRDLWTQNHAYPYSYLRKKIERKLELNTLKLSSAITTVSLPLANKLKKIHKKDVYEITNGFFYKNINIIKNNNKFTISYTGQIYTKFQNIEIIIIAISELINEGKVNKNKIIFNYYGPNLPELDIKINKYKLSNLYKNKGVKPWHKIKEIQLLSDLLILLNWENKKEKGIYYTKSFEYLSSKTPFIATGGYGGDVIEKLLKQTKGGFYCKTIKETKKVLLKYYKEWEKSGHIEYKGIDFEINKYNYKNTTKKLTEIFNKYI